MTIIISCAPLLRSTYVFDAETSFVRDSRLKVECTYNIHGVVVTNNLKTRTTCKSNLVSII